MARRTNVKAEKRAEKTEARVPAPTEARGVERRFHPMVDRRALSPVHRGQMLADQPIRQFRCRRADGDPSRQPAGVRPGCRQRRVRVASGPEGLISPPVPTQVLDMAAYRAERGGTPAVPEIARGTEGPKKAPVIILAPRGPDVKTA